MYSVQFLRQKWAVHRFIIIHCSCCITQCHFRHHLASGALVSWEWWDERKPGSDQKADGQKHLNNIMFFHVHKNAMDEIINFEHVASEFVQHTGGRKLYFGVEPSKLCCSYSSVNKFTDVIVCGLQNCNTCPMCLQNGFFFTQLLMIFSLEYSVIVMGECSTSLVYHKKIGGKFDVHNFL
jgi:hypothetical protein